jgi:hypothetical protein
MKDDAMDDAVREWFEKHDAYHKASAAYNARLALVRAERERGNWSMPLDAEYRTLNDAQSAAISAAETLYHAVVKNMAADLTQAVEEYNAAVNQIPTQTKERRDG